MVDSTHPFFTHPEALEAELRRCDAEVPADARPRGSFDSSPVGGVERVQGRVWGQSGVAGVWAVRDPAGHLTDVVFWTVINGTVRVENLPVPTCGRAQPGLSPETALVAEAAAWRERQA